uniref:Uncharacterized protein n=1 Tax=Oryza meridionalis TaxID=40149 RepID=A0A0E0CK63_9ORYZ
MPSTRKTAPTGVAIIVSTSRTSRTKRPGSPSLPTTTPLATTTLPRKAGEGYRCRACHLQAAPTPPNTPYPKTRQEANSTATPMKLPKRRGKGVIVAQLATPGQAAPTPPQTPSTGCVAGISCTNSTKPNTSQTQEKLGTCSAEALELQANLPTQLATRPLPRNCPQPESESRLVNRRRGAPGMGGAPADQGTCRRTSHRQYCCSTYPTAFQMNKPQ